MSVLRMESSSVAGSRPCATPMPERSQSAVHVKSPKSRGLRIAYVHERDSHRTQENVTGVLTSILSDG